MKYFRKKVGVWLLFVVTIQAVSVPALSASDVLSAQTVSSSSPERLRVLASIFPVWLLARNVVSTAGVDIDLLVSAAAGCPHDYALTPIDVRRLEEADVLLLNGLGLEAFLGGNPGLTGSAVVESADGVGLLMETCSGSHAGEEHDGCVNPHLLASPRMAAQMAIQTGRQMARLDPARAEIYQSQAAAYAAELDQLADRLALVGQKIGPVAAQEGIFDYLIRDAGLEVVTLLPGHGEGTPSAAELIRLARQIRERGAVLILTEGGSSARIGQILAEETDLPAVQLDPVSAGPVNAPADYYLTVMKANIHALETALEPR